MRRLADVDGKRTAVLAESLYLANLLILPLVSALALLWLFVYRRRCSSAVAKAHIEQAINASIVLLILAVVLTAGLLVLHMSGVADRNLWTVAVILFTLIHTSMVMLGIIGLAKAMAGECWRYPVIGRRLPAGCRKPDARA